LVDRCLRLIAGNAPAGTPHQYPSGESRLGADLSLKIEEDLIEQSIALRVWELKKNSQFRELCCAYLGRIIDLIKRLVGAVNVVPPLTRGSGFIGNVRLAGQIADRGTGDPIGYAFDPACAALIEIGRPHGFRATTDIVSTQPYEAWSGIITPALLSR
jgi:hypothetical protein